MTFFIDDSVIYDGELEYHFSLGLNNVDDSYSYEFKDTVPHKAKVLFCNRVLDFEFKHRFKINTIYVCGYGMDDTVEIFHVTCPWPVE